MSFISVEPQSRVHLESHTDYLLTQFDTQLRIIADRYLAFFQERLSIEATYLSSLRKLYRRAKTVDASFDPGAEPTTTRTAWDKVRDNLERDADAQQAFMDILANDVIKPLEILKESNDKTRKRIEKSLKRSATDYADYAENVVSKFQQAYLRKYQPQQHAYSADVSQHPQDVPIPNKKYGSRVTALFRGPREDSKAAPSEEVSNDDCREVVTHLNNVRLSRAEDLEEGYDLLEDIVFTPTIKDVLVNYMDGVIKACAKHDDIAKGTRTEVENALDGTDTCNLKVSFRQALSFSTPPYTLYRNYRHGGYSNLIFGVPLVDLGINGDNVPKVMRMCIEEIEKRGLNTNEIYSSSSMYGTDVKKASEMYCADQSTNLTRVRIQLRDRFESERSSSLTSTNNIYSVAALLKRYLCDLPDPLFSLSLQDYRHYTQRGVNYTERNLSLLRSKISKQPLVHRASLEALLRHLMRVASHSYKNGMTAKVLSTLLYRYVFGGNEVLEGGINAKRLLMEDLIQNAHTLFDDPSPLRPVTPPDVAASPMSSYTYTSSLFASPHLPQFGTIPATRTSLSFSSDGFVESHQNAHTLFDEHPSPLRPVTPPDVAASPMSSYNYTSALFSSPQLPHVTIPATPQHRPELVHGIPTSTRSSLSFSSDGFVESRLTPPQRTLSPLPLGLSSSRTLSDGEETTTQERPKPGARGTEAIRTFQNSTPPEVVPFPSVAEWLSHQSRLPPHPEALTIPPSPPESVLLSESDFSHSSATSLDTRS